ncbi:hypothetical protein [Desulfobacula toluolica]|uniref:Uncharacterized putative membrane protein n=1 Tax=Desulfobacula toluolica (strain DSM 7467 / Tol2) TaxID=651182 RepID=K0NI05_DESTT|nr:hypothetical protein [Desulfobacula toluolica]CCK79448.1 uncharacterized putative membrane protein [Desulfobacula toluolica Tol2]
MNKHLSVQREKTAVFLSIIVMCLLTVNFFKSHHLSEPFEIRFVVSSVILLLVCFFFRFCLTAVTPLIRSLYRISVVMAFWSFCFFLFPFPNMVLYMIPLPGFYFLFRIETKEAKRVEDALAAGILMAMGTFLYIQQRPLQAVLFPDQPFDWINYYIHSPVVILMGTGFLRLSKHSDWKGLSILGTLLITTGSILLSGYLIKPFWPYFPEVLCAILCLHLVQIYFILPHNGRALFIRFTNINETDLKQLNTILYFMSAFIMQACIVQLIGYHGLDHRIISAVILAAGGLLYRYRQVTISMVMIEMALLFFVAGTFYFRSYGLIWSIPIGIIILLSVISRLKKQFLYPVSNAVINVLFVLYYLLIFQFNLLHPLGILFILFPFMCWVMLSGRPFAVPRTYHFAFWPVITFIVLICLLRGITQGFFLYWALINLFPPLCLNLIIRTKTFKTQAVRLNLHFINDWEDNSQQALFILAYISAGISITSIVFNLQWYMDSWMPVLLTGFVFMISSGIFLAYALTRKKLGFVIQTECFFWALLALIRWKLDVQETLDFGSPVDGYLLIAISVIIAGIRDVLRKKIPEFSGYFQKTILFYGVIGWLYLQAIQFFWAGNLTGTFHHAELSSILMAALNLWLSKAGKNVHSIYTVIFINMALLLYFFNQDCTNLMFYIFPSMYSALILIQMFKDKLGAENTKNFRLIVSLILCGTCSFYNIMDFGSSIWYPVIATFMSSFFVVAGIPLKVRIFLYLGTLFFIVNAIGVIAHIIINQPAENITLSIGILFLVAGILFTASFLFFQMKRQQVIDRYHQIASELETWE